MDKDYPKEYFEQEFNSRLNKTAHFTNKVNNVMEMILPIKKGEVILDVGTCSGTFAFECYKYTKNITATDVSKQAIERCKKEAKQRGYNIRFVCCSAENINFFKKRFDKIIMGDIVEHLPKKIFKKVIENYHKILKPNGKIIIYTPNKKHFLEILKSKNFILTRDPTHINLMTLQEIINELEKNNFKIEKAYYKNSHIRLIRLVENLILRLKFLSEYFGRRICIVGRK